MYKSINKPTLILTDTRCSDLALAAASRIRVSDFYKYHFTVSDSNQVVIHNLEDFRVGVGVTELKFRDEMDLVDFISAAFANCVLETLLLRNKASCDAMSKMASTILIKRALSLHGDAFVNVHALVKFAVSFRNLKVCPTLSILLVSVGKWEKNFLVQPWFRGRDAVGNNISIHATVAEP